MKKTILVMIGSSLLAGVARADVIYKEAFNNSSGADASLDVVDWNVNVSASGTSIAKTPAGPFLSLNSSVFSSNDNSRWLVWTDEASFGSISNITSLSMDLQNNDGTTEDLQFALKIDGNWYVSQSVLNGRLWENVSLDVQSGLWNSLDFVADSSLVEGAVANLPESGTLQAVGVYNNLQSDRVRIDNFTIQAIPEPSAAGMLLGLGAVVTVVARRHTSH
ncbi:hypothetical protein ACWPKO_15880 [Coraliomargarita sp. W4R53]